MAKLNNDLTTIATVATISSLTQAVIKNLDGQGLSIYGDPSRDNPDVVLNRLISARLFNNLANKRS